MTNIVRDKNLSESSQHLAQIIIAKINAKLIKKERISIAFSGGNSPQELLQILAKKITQKQWRSIDIFQVDERCVMDCDYKITNHYLIKKNLLNITNIAQSNLFFTERLKTYNSPENIAFNYNNILLNYFQKHHKKAFDIVILGMGNDGHTASIFPDSALLKYDTTDFDLMKAVKAPTTAEPQVPRITLTFKAINNAENIFVLLNGEHKMSLLINDIEKKLPISQISPKAIFFAS